MYSQHLSSVLSKEVLHHDMFKLTLRSSAVARRAKPGNFVHVRVGDGDYPLLRRAFSVHDAQKSRGQFEILFKVVGKGTEILSRRNPGDSLDVLGPVGNSFSLPQKTDEAMLVAGGMGIAPLWFLLAKLIKRFDKNKLIFFLGARTKRELVYAERLKETGAGVIVATDDGSMGRKGMVTDVFLKEIKTKRCDHRKLAVYSCGPQLMLQRMAEIAERLDLFCQVSLETHMACGVGACWGCAAKQKDGTYKRACVDGPVFDSRELDFG